MAEDHLVDRTRRRPDMATSMKVGLLVLLLAGVVALFVSFGEPGRVDGGPAPAAPNTANVNVAPPALLQPQSGPQLDIPRQIDVNLNQPPAQVQVVP